MVIFYHALLCSCLCCSVNLLLHSKSPQMSWHKTKVVLLYSQFSEAGIWKVHSKDSLPLFHNVWGLSLECLKAGGWNHLKAHSVTGLACDAGCQLTHLHVVCLYGRFWASLEHGGWVPRARVAGDRKWKLLVSEGVVPETGTMSLLYSIGQAVTEPRFKAWGEGYTDSTFFFLI